MKKIAIILLSLLMVFALVACGGNNGTDTNTNTNTDTSSDTNTNTDTSTDTTTDTNTSTDTGNEGGETPDVPQVPTYESSSVEDTLKEELGVFEEETTFGNEGSLGFTTTNDIDVSKYLNKKISINQGGTYKVYGTSSDGQIYIEAANQDVYIVLAGVSLTSGNSVTGPAIFAKDCASVTIILEDGTENYLADNLANDGEGAVIRVRSCPLTLDGTGSLTIEAKAKNAIANTKELTVEGGKYNIKAPGHGIYGKLGLVINGGTFNIEAGKSGFKSGDGDNTKNYEYGYIDINAGNTVISCGTNGFNCVGPVTVDNGRVEINAETGNAIDAVQSITINGGTMILNSYKSAIATEDNVTIQAKSNIKIETTGNGISAKEVTISNNGVIYIVTTAVYELATSDTPADETKYVLKDGEYTVYDEAVDGKNVKLYIMRNCKGIKADIVTISNGTIGIDAYQDAINSNEASIIGGKLVLASYKDAIEALNVTVSNNANISIIGAEKGINADTVEISGGALYAVADKDSINANSTVVSGGTVYLFDKIDTGTNGTITVNGGVLLIIATTKNPITTDGTADYISGDVVNKEVATAGTWIKVIGGDDMAKVELPKDYTDKMTVYFSTTGMADDIMVTFGTVDEEDTFTVIKTETIKR